VNGRSREVVLALDVGGSSLKSALVSRGGRVRRGSFRREPVDAQGSREGIIRSLVDVIACGLRAAESAGLDCTGIGIAMPGPFDYRAGISLMTHKFGAVFGVNLMTEVRRGLRLDDALPVAFVHDAGAFLLGEAWRGAARGSERAMAITLGTGIGSACMGHGRLATTDAGMPLYSVWNQPYQGGIVEDAVSRATIIARYGMLTGHPVRGDVEQVASRALKSGDRAARQVFAELGDTLGLAIRPTVLSVQPDVIVFGGRISKSFRLFADPLRAQLKAVPHLKEVVPGTSIDFSALYGAAKAVWR